MEQLNLFFSIIGWLFVFLFVFLFVLAIFSIPIMGFLLTGIGFILYASVRLKLDDIATFGLFGVYLVVHLVWCYYLDKRKFYDNIR